MLLPLLVGVNNIFETQNKVINLMLYVCVQTHIVYTSRNSCYKMDSHIDSTKQEKKKMEIEIQNTKCAKKEDREKNEEIE